MEFQAMGELEYYVIAPDSGMFPATDQKGYHESAPYAKFNDFRTQCMAYIAQAGGQIKYGHSEVGNFTLNGMIYEQNEIEFLPVRAEDAADQLMIAKWIIRNLAYKNGYDITFAPKITTGKAGSGLHIHMRIMKDSQSHCRNDDYSPFNYRFWQYKSNFLFQTGSTPGSSHKHLLGRPQPFCSGPGTFGMGCQNRYVHNCKSVGKPKQL